MWLVNTKFQSDGSILQKIEIFSSSGLSRKFYKDLEEVGDINERLNLTSGDQDWLSLRPSGARYFKDDNFGELNEENNLHGRGIDTDGGIYIQHWNNGDYAPGNYIHIYSSDGDFRVGERYLKDGRMHRRCTRNKTDGTIDKFGY